MKSSKTRIHVNTTIDDRDIARTCQVLIDNGIEKSEAMTVLQAIGYTLLDTELWPE